MIHWELTLTDGAILTVEGTSDFGFVKKDPLQRHKLGLYSAPLYTVTQPFAPDDGWDVQVNPDGAYLEGAIADASPQMPDWVKDRSGTEVINHLPPGAYVIVRSDKRPKWRDPIYLGNDAVTATPNMRSLLWIESPIDAVIVGAPTEVPPRLDCPLVGLVICHHTSVRFPSGSNELSQHLIVFFSFCNGRNRPEARDDRLTLVIPVTGESITDNLQLSTSNTQEFVPASEDPAFRSVWANSFATAAASILAGRTE